MKNILVPTDFSECAQYAEHAAVLLAQSKGASILWLHCLPEDGDSVHSEDAVAQGRRALNERKASAEKRGIPSTTLTVSKSLVGAMEEIAASGTVDFVVMGSHGASGKNELFIGSNTQKVVRTVHLPVLIIKEPLEKIEFDSVIYASGFDVKGQQSFRNFIDFVKDNSPLIHLLCINAGGFFAQPSIIVHAAMEEFEKIAAPLSCQKHFYKDYSIEVGIRRFLEESDADLIAISNHARRPLKRMLFGSNVEALVLQARKPVLSLDFPDLT